LKKNISEKYLKNNGQKIFENYPSKNIKIQIDTQIDRKEDF